MADVIVSQFMTLNGVIEANGARETHPHGGWQFKSGYGDDHQRYKEEEVDEAWSLLVGRKTYDTFAAFWPHEQGRSPTSSTRCRSMWCQRHSPILDGRTRR
jgi:dihydrofolate reductase